MIETALPKGTKEQVESTPLSFFDRVWPGSYAHATRGFWSELWRWALTFAIAGALTVGLLLGSLIAAIYIQARQDQSHPVDAIIVLGTAQYNGTPSPDLQARLDEALAAWDDGLAQTIIVTGGKLPGDTYTEAESSRNYLVDHGVPESAILLEDQGHDSWESMSGAAELARANDLDRVLIISDGFHLFRLKAMARALDLSPSTRAATSSPIKRNSSSELQYVIREAGATIKFELDRLF